MKKNILTSKEFIKKLEIDGIENTHNDIELLERTPKDYSSNGKCGREPAKGDLVTEIESYCVEHGIKLATFDGYIVPKKDSSRVSKLFFCREFSSIQQHGLITDDQYIKAVKLLIDDVDLVALQAFSEILNTTVDFVIVPKNYPKDKKTAQEKSIFIIKNILGEFSKEKLNVNDFREYLKKSEKRLTTKSMTFSPTKLEYYLANVKRPAYSIVDKDTKETVEMDYAFPGDADGVLFDENMNPFCLLEYKSDTQNNNQNEENMNRYPVDATRFEVLEDLSNILKVPLVIIFWSDHHNNAKISWKLPTLAKGFEKLIKAENYEELAERIMAYIKALAKYYELCQRITAFDQLLGTIFTEQVFFVSYENNELIWESCLNYEQRRIMGNYWKTIQSEIYSIFGEETKIEKIECKQ